MRAQKRPVIIEFVRWNGYNSEEVSEFLGSSLAYIKDERVAIQTLEGLVTASVGDMIIRGVAGEFYPCKPDIFLKTYQILED